MKSYIKLNDENNITKLFFIIDNDNYQSSIRNAIEIDYNKLIKYVSRQNSMMRTLDTTSSSEINEELIIGAHFDIDEYNNIE